MIFVGQIKLKKGNTYIMKTLIALIALNIFYIIPMIAQDEPQADTSNISAEADSAYNFLLTQLENADLGYLWAGELSQSNRLGYIGEDFQRLEVRFLSIIKNFDNPYEYFLYGKTRVEEVICEFQGSLLITETGYIQDEEQTEFERAYISGNFVLFEDQACLHSGIFRGNFITGIYLDEQGDIYYDDLNREEDDFINNEFFGEWEGYYPYELKPANWGDFRIPNSLGLDVGDDEFKPSFQTLDNGWREYLQGKSEDSGEEGNMWWEW